MISTFVNEKKQRRDKSTIRLQIFMIRCEQRKILDKNYEKFKK